MIADLPSLLGLCRSLAIYYAMPWRRRALRRFYAGFIEPGDLVFDIGAHVGSRARTLRSLGAAVVAIEPQPLFARFLRATLPRRGVTLVVAAVGRVAGEARLQISRRHPTVSTLSPGWIAAVGPQPGFRGVAWDRSVTVPVRTLEDLVLEFGLPRFCKIDVEGLEAEILAGLGRPIPLLAFEYLAEAPSVAADSIRRLTSLGPYRFNRVDGETHRFRLEEWVEAPAMLAFLDQLPPGAPSGDIYARLDM